MKVSLNLGCFILDRLCTSDEKPSAVFWKMVFKCFEICSNEYYIFRKKYICFISLVSIQKIWCFVIFPVITSRQRSKPLRFFGDEFSAALSKLRFKTADKNFEKKRFFDKITKFYHLRILGEKIADYGWKGCDSVVKTSLYVSRERVGEIGCFEQFLASFYNYRAESEKMLEFWQLISNRFTGTTFYVSNRFVIILRRIVLFGRIFFYKLFVDQEWKVLELLRILSWQCCYTCNRFEESLVKTIFFRKGVRFCHNFWTMSKYNWPVCVNHFFVYLWQKSLVFVRKFWWFSRTEFQPFKGSIMR